MADETTQMQEGKSLKQNGSNGHVAAGDGEQHHLQHQHQSNGKHRKAGRYPFDPLTPDEIEVAASVIRRRKPDMDLAFNCIALHEPKKAAMLAWLASRVRKVHPPRIADVVVIERGGKVYDCLVDVDCEELLSFEHAEGVQPMLTMADLQLVEKVARTDPRVIEQCGILGIPPEHMDRVYCDPWTIGYDERFGSDIRLQQALMYYRPHIDDLQYTYPLDFCPIFNGDTHEIIHIDVPPVRRPLNQAPPCNYTPAAVKEQYGGYQQSIKPLTIDQPEGVSFKVDGRQIEWAKWKFHVGFNHREGVVLNNITFNDKGKDRSVFYRLSLAEMVVPYGNPEHPHQRKHAFDLGEYGGGNMTNSLALGCDCKGAIHYMDAHLSDRDGRAQTIKNAVCIHEEDGGILFKHTDFRDNSVIVTRARKLIVSHVFTAANYEYCVYWIFHLDGTVQLEIKLTGILNTYAMNPDEDTHGWGTQVYPGVNAHNHQHLFCLRVDPNIDGSENTVVQVDAVRGPGEVGSKENKYGNAFRALKTPFKTAKEAVADYDGSTMRTWDMVNPNKINPHSGKPVGYKLVSREVPTLLPREDGLVWKRAGFARHAIHVTPYHEGQLHPAGRHVPQTSGSPTKGLPEWLEKHGDESIENTDVVLWHTFGVNHFPSPEDFPIMPAEPMALLLRPRHFFDRNPALDVPPSYCSLPSQVKAASAANGGSGGDGHSGVAAGVENVKPAFDGTDLASRAV